MGVAVGVSVGPALGVTVAVAVGVGVGVGLGVVVAAGAGTASTTCAVAAASRAAKTLRTGRRCSEVTCSPIWSPEAKVTCCGRSAPLTPKNAAVGGWAGE